MKTVRFIKPTEIRMVVDDPSIPKVQGYASVFNSPSELMTDSAGNPFREIMRPGCFANALAAGADCRFLLNHTDLPLARTTSGTLSLVEDERGLSFTANLDPSDPDVQRIIPKMKRGDLDQCSFAFSTNKDGVLFRTENGIHIREVHEVSDLFDVSMVTYPAYTAAGASLRALGEVDDPDFKAWLLEQKAEAEKQERAKDFHGCPDVLRRRLSLHV